MIPNALYLEPVSVIPRLYCIFCHPPLRGARGPVVSLTDPYRCSMAENTTDSFRQKIPVGKPAPVSKHRNLAQGKNSDREP